MIYVGECFAYVLHFLYLFALSNSQTGLGAQSYLWKALWSIELIKMIWFSVYIEITF